MKALRLHAARDLRLHDEPSPEPGAGEALLRVTAVGLCGSDRHWFEEGGIGDAVLVQPLVLGHEFVGVIEHGPRAGERVAVDPAIPCGTCAACAAGRSHLCLSGRFAGHGRTDGALRGALAWPERLVHSLPDSLGDAEATLLEPLGVAVHALDLGHVHAGMRAGVFGCGPIGLLIVQVLLEAGATVAASDVLAHRLAVALELGAERWDGAEVDVAFEAAGDDGALDDAIAATCPGGRVVLVGIPVGDSTSFTASTARRKELTFFVSRRMEPADLARAIDLAGGGRVALAPLVTGRHPLDDWAGAFDELVRQEGVKVVIEP
jgi:L-iditol 2-dehydrogenase